jgi:hypothetical protein
MGKKRSPRLSVDPVKWEWRAFWPNAATPPSMDKLLKRTRRCKHSRFADHYLVIEASPDNVKVRKGRLQVKQLVERHNHYRAYRRKQKFTFPLDRRELVGIFPRLMRADRALSGREEVISALRELGYQVRCYRVRKDRYKWTSRGLAYEWTKLKVRRRCFGSMAVEGSDIERVEREVEKVPDGFMLVGGYRQLFRDFGSLA